MRDAIDETQSNGWRGVVEIAGVLYGLTPAAPPPRGHPIDCLLHGPRSSGLRLI